MKFLSLCVQRLLSGKQLRFYIGADPTGPSLHLSHAKNFMLLEEFRQLGHKVIVLFGDMTACIGDPSDRSSARAKLTREDARKNAESWVNQIRCIINFDDAENPAEMMLNSTWFDKFTLVDTIELVSNATVQQLLERDMFQKRIKDNKPIFLHEFLYPMFQGYDSVAMDVDVELCGTDQIFNALRGRDLVKSMKNKEKFVVAVNLMENPVTGELMSKTNNTGVFLGTDANTMFGQIMALPDEMIEIILVNNTRLPLEEIARLKSLENPRDAKIVTARTVASLFYGEEAALVAENNFISTFSNKQFPDDAPRLTVSTKEIEAIELLKLCETGESTSQLRRLFEQGAVTLNGQKVASHDVMIAVGENMQLKVGKRGFYRIN